MSNIVREEYEREVRRYSFVFPPPRELSENLLLARKAIEAADYFADALNDAEPCEWDHNHSCQAHGFYYIPQGEKCPVQAAKDWLDSDD